MKNGVTLNVNLLKKEKFIKVIGHWVIIVYFYRGIILLPGQRSSSDHHRCKYDFVIYSI